MNNLNDENSSALKSSSSNMNNLNDENSSALKFKSSNKIIAISGSVGSGKTSFAKHLCKKLNEKVQFTCEKYEVVELNKLALKYKVSDVPELQTFDFDIDKLVFEFNKYLSENKDKNLIIEGHFAHFLDPEMVDYLFVISRSLDDLKKEYIKRGYNEKKIEDNLEVESFNLCFYEGIEEGYKEEEQIFLLENSGSLDKILYKVLEIITE